MAASTPQYAANVFVRSILRDLGHALGGFEDEHWQEALEFFDHRCAYTGMSMEHGPLEKDHAVPINRTHGGLHLRGNVVPSTAEANQAKGGAHFAEFLRDAPERRARIEAFQAATGYAELAEEFGDLSEFLQHHYRIIVRLHATACETLRARIDEPLPITQSGQSPASPGVGLASDAPLEVVLQPADPKEFRTALLRTRRASLEEHYEDGTVKTRTWSARRFKPTSDVIANIRTRANYRAGPRASSGLLKVIARIEPAS